MEKFFNCLKRVNIKNVFNPWFEHDLENDIHTTAPQIRLNNLKLYLEERRNAAYLLLAEAVGYQGGHFTGIPMTSERIILGKKQSDGILPSHVCREPLSRTSNGKVHLDGFNEPTATIVWKKLIEEGLDTKNFVLWNAFAWHPYKREKGLLSNRTPNQSEMNYSEAVLKAFLDSFNFKKIIALGNKSYDALDSIGIMTVKVRHPAMGGADLFRDQFMKIVLQ